MGRKYYFFTKKKNDAIRFFPDTYLLVDEPDFGYLIYIAKTSGGWKPLFQEHASIKCVRDIKNVFLNGEFVIFDEYFDKPLIWEEFEKNVIGWQNDNPKAKSHVDSDRERGISFFHCDNEGFDFIANGLP